MKHLLIVMALVVSCSLSIGARADEASDIQHLQTRWADIKYQAPENSREKALASLVGEAETMRKANPDKPSYLIWEGTIRSTYANIKGGLGALEQVKLAKKLFEQSIAIAPEALDGSAYTILGSLYYKVPGWPVGFGDAKKAEEMLLKGLSYNPEGIDSNYWYGEYLLDQKQYQKAVTVLEKALQAPARPGRESADAGRKEEIQTALANAKKHL